MKIKMKGNFWYTNGEDTVYVRVILYIFVNELFIRGWKLYGNFNFKSIVNTFFFERDVNIIFGL